MSVSPLAPDLILILLTALICGLIAKKLRLPLLVGYLIGGMVFGRIIASFIPENGIINSIAEIGVALLLFTIGLEFSLQRLKESAEVIIFGSFIQILLSILIGTVIFPLLGLDFWTSLFLGIVFSLSSTAIVVKSLSDIGELETLHGEITQGWLFFQDLWTIPIMVVLPFINPLLNYNNIGLISTSLIIRNLIISLSLFVIIIALGKNFVPKLFEKIADFKSRELLLISAVIFCLTFAYLFQRIGLSYAMGAFVAGILISSSSAHHGIFAEVRPLRDLFATVFFISLGFMLDPFFIFKHWLMISILVVTVMLIKLFISFLLVIFLGFHTKIAALVGLLLISVGEFAFIISMNALQLQLINNETFLIIISVSFITLIISVPVIYNNFWIYYSLNHFINTKFPWVSDKLKTLNHHKQFNHTQLIDHVVVLGHGRVGKYICRALTMAQIPYLVVDYDHKIVKKLREEGINVIYGDPAEIDVLEFAQIKKAKVIIIAYEDRYMQKAIVINTLSMNPGITLICRSHHEEDKKILLSLGVKLVVQPEFEAAVTMVGKLLQMFNIEEKEIAGKISRLKIEHGLAG
ncbi:hypothetical protein A2960_02480 [Candidatus Gottesmanbacteria bacterium RIFCSPLOWO2_01_FULL_39_12b]|uniref:RCK N-terminal domain-containing protein n=1 Tax=Candidatus Gottesmanbacteria bacterium RIFCSPLOWO2_01_FULL_39_12b TaxID=1798388 RepID=A0A1F6AQM7_9BACT|nr:MAG: hypothetical protein A2960_02480 [Candidatus Gottesmanbacteria bacterium RIFCSPLOWO2_01_FULL_39_12b]